MIEPKAKKGRQYANTTERVAAAYTRVRNIVRGLLHVVDEMDRIGWVRDYPVKDARQVRAAKKLLKDMGYPYREGP